MIVRRSRLSPTTTVGIGVFASSTIGGGTGATGLTISGGATSTQLVLNGTGGSGFVSFPTQVGAPATSTGRIVLVATTTQGFTRLQTYNEGATHVTIGRNTHKWTSGVC